MSGFTRRQFLDAWLKASIVSAGTSVLTACGGGSKTPAQTAPPGPPSNPKIVAPVPVIPTPPPPPPSGATPNFWGVKHSPGL